MEAKYLQTQGNLAAAINFFRKQIYIDGILVILNFAKSPQHSACLHVTESTSVHYDSLKNPFGRPFTEYKHLWNIGQIEIHTPEFYQEGDECGCMVVLRYWHLFHGKPYNLSGKRAQRAKVLNYYKGNHSMLAEGTARS